MSGYQDTQFKVPSFKNDWVMTIWTKNLIRIYRTMNCLVTTESSSKSKSIWPIIVSKYLIILLIQAFQVNSYILNFFWRIESSEFWWKWFMILLTYYLLHLLIIIVILLLLLQFSQTTATCSFFHIKYKTMLLISLEGCSFWKT